MILIHGEDAAKSRDFLNSLRKDYENKNFQITTIPGDKVDTLIVEDLGSSQSLFNEKRLIIVEDFFSNKKNKDRKWSAGIETIFYESGKLSSLPKNIELEVRTFDFEPVVFKFLDSIYPGNQQVFVPLYYKYLMSTPAELAFTMIVRQFRFMILSLEKGSDNPSDFYNLASWQLNKLKSQASKFGQEKLVLIYRNLSQIDEETKTGKSELPLESRLELFLLTL